jgi:hypothetical protein
MNRAGTPDDPPSTGAPAPDAFDQRLHRHFADATEPADDGFTYRVLAALPPPAVHQPGRWLARARWAQWVASGIASGVAAALLGATEGRIEGEQGVAALALLALLALWSWPARWLRP